MKRILVAEDEPAISSLIAWNLERVGFDVEVASDGAWAERRLETAPPDALVLDLLLPLRSGWQILRRVRAASSPLAALPIVVVSALSSARLKGELAASSVHDVLGKPFSVAELCSVVRRLTGGPSPAGAGSPAPDRDRSLSHGGRSSLDDESYERTRGEGLRGCGAGAREPP